jgi:hypothetical protein
VLSCDLICLDVIFFAGWGGGGLIKHAVKYFLFKVNFNLGKN